MPLIVDKAAVREEILMAFQRCIDKKPLMNVSLRDIAAEAGMSHPKLLNYFGMEQCLVQIYGPEVGRREAEAMMILIAGTFICNYNNALTGEISDDILGSFAGLLT